MRTLRLLLVVCAVSLAGCMELQRRLHYDNLDDVAVDATGKQLWELQLGEQEIKQIRERLGRTKTTSLYCIRDNVERSYNEPEGLSPRQIKQRVKNLKVVVKEALIPVIEMRESEAKRRIVLEGCNTR